MPFRSEKQRRYLWANDPKLARKWTDEYGSKLVGKKGKKKMKKRVNEALLVMAADAAVEEFCSLAFDEAKHPRGKRGTSEGGRFTKANETSIIARQFSDKARTPKEHQRAEKAHVLAAKANRSAGRHVNAEYHDREASKHSSKVDSLTPSADAKDLSEGADVASAFASNKATHGVAAHYHRKAAAAHPLGHPKVAYHKEKQAYHEKIAYGPMTSG